MELSLVRGIVPRTVFGLTAIAAIILIIGLELSKSKKRGRLHPLIVSLIAAVLVGAAGLLVAWLVSDVFMVFGVSLGWPVIFTIAGGIAGVGFVIAAAVTLRGVRRALAVVLVPLVLLSTALGVDSIYGEYQTIGTLVGYTPYASLGSIEVHKAAMSVSDWHSKARKGSLPSMPSQGKVLTVDIPNTESNFTARKAMIYLPPAALSDRPPALPVMELLAGQPGSPSRLIDAGNIAATMNAYAAKHDGLAPIVLVPDQNDGAVLEDTLAWAYARPGILDVCIVPLGFTKHQSVFDRSFNDPVSSRAVMDLVIPFQRGALAERGSMWAFPADEFYHNAYGPELLRNLPPSENYGDFGMFEDGVGIFR